MLAPKGALISTADNRNLMCRSAGRVVLLLLPVFCALAQDSPLAGDWIGTLDVPGTRSHPVLHVTRLDDGTLKGTLDSPGEGVKAAALDDLRLDLDLVRFRCKVLSASYLGKLSGDVINGTLKQRGFALKLVFERSVADPSPPRVRPQHGE
jgi:hypothetical protein